MNVHLLVYIFVCIKTDVKIEKEMKNVSTAVGFKSLHQKFLQVWLEIFFQNFQESWDHFLEFPNFSRYFQAFPHHHENDDFSRPSINHVISSCVSNSAIS